MTRRRVQLADRTTVAVGASVAAGLAVGGQLGGAVALLVFVAVQFPAVFRGVRTGAKTDSRPAAAAVLAGAALVAVLGVEHLTWLLAGSVVAAFVTWAWPWARRGAPRAKRAVGRGRPKIKGNHHGRATVIEEVPDGRVGVARKKGGDGPTRIVLCAKADREGQLVKTAQRRHVHARWRVSSRPTPCPIEKSKRHWQLSTAGKAKRG